MCHAHSCQYFALFLARLGAIATLAFIAICAGRASARVIYVKADATGPNSGDSWSAAYTDLQTALTQAEWGDEIWVTAGTYTPTNDTDRTKSFVMPAGVAIYGGFTGGEANREERNWAAHETVLSGDIGKEEETADNSYHVVVGGFNAVLDGFTITRGSAYGSRNGSYGGGILNDSVSPRIVNCTIRNNLGHYGCGMYNLNASPTVAYCTFACNGNSIDTREGGGMSNHNSSPAVTNCMFNGNTAEDGGGMYNTSDSPTIVNCTFNGNSASNQGGGLFVFYASLSITNCIFWGNSAMLGSEICVLTSGGAISNYYHCDIKGSGGSGAQWNPALGIDSGGNIMADPLFVDVANPAGADGIWMTDDDGLALQAVSPCIDAGLVDDAPTTDILGNPRVGAPDIGAYEYASSSPTPTPTPLPPVPVRITISCDLSTTSASTADGKTIKYTYVWSNGRDHTVTHGPKANMNDILAEMDLARPGDLWTVTVTPSAGDVTGPSTTAKVRILNPDESGAAQWALYE
ncbi:MAG: right-handed parallel beta-helix repeat-containing protein [bacterium]|nr:right-handed parallel beta-helix repeat-containing protein [bacterium]